MLAPGTIVAGKFRIERILGEGGMGVVAIATHVQLDQRVALKVVSDAVLANPAIIERFLREARAVAKLRSEHVCHVFDFGQLETGAPYLVMELLDGRDLEHEIGQRALPPPVAVDYVVQACVAIAEAHACGIVHRDLKPANLFVTRRLDGSPLVKVLDFGIAKAPMESASSLTATHTVMGTPGYMAPEQLRSTRDVDARADVWALGVILYQALSGRLPFPAGSLTEVAVKIAIDPPDPIDVAPGLREIVMRCLEKDPARRYPDVDALAQALAPFGPPPAHANAALAMRLLAGTSGTLFAAPAPTPEVRGTTLNAAAGAAQTVPTRRRRWPWWVAGAVAVGAIAVGVILAMPSGDGAPAPVAANVASGAPPAQAPVPAPAAPAPPAPAPAAPAPAAPAPPAPAPPAPAATPPRRAPTRPAKESAPPRPQPAPQPATASEREFAAALASHHCLKASAMMRDLTPPSTERAQQVSDCLREIASAFTDYTHPEKEAWVIAETEDLAASGQAEVARKQLASYYYARLINACRAKDAAAARAPFHKLQDPQLHETAIKVCNAFGVTLE